MQINIFHISDLHLATTPFRKELLYVGALFEADSYKRFLEKDLAASFDSVVVSAVSDFVNKNRNSIDAILITGDISTTGRKCDLQEALDIVTGNGEYKGLAKLTKLRNPCFEFPSSIPLHLLPGNHDRYDTDGRFYSPGSKNFHDVFKSVWDEDVRVEKIDKGDFSVGLILADFSLTTAQEAAISYDLLSQLKEIFGYDSATVLQRLAGFAQGKVHKTVLYQLITKTAEFIENAGNRNKKPFIIWAIHFPPRFPRSRTFNPFKRLRNKIKDEYKKLIDEDKLIYAAERLGVNAIFAGHTHQHKFYKVGGIDVSCSGSTTQYIIDEGDMINNYCHIFSINPTNNDFDISVADFKYDRRRRITANEFIKVPR